MLSCTRSDRTTISRVEIRNIERVDNQLEQGVRRNTLLISGVSETFAERVTDGNSANNPPQNVREGTINPVCTVIKEACKINVNSSDIYKLLFVFALNPIRCSLDLSWLLSIHHLFVIQWLNPDVLRKPSHSVAQIFT